MISCQVCNQLFNAINKRHLASHGITREEYINKYPDAPLQSKESAEKRKSASMMREKEMTKETKAIRNAKIASSRLGQTSWNAGNGGYTLEWSEEAKIRVKERGAWNRGVAATEEQKAKQSTTMKDGFASGRIVHWNLGNVTPIEVRQKIAASCAGKMLTPEQREKHLKAIRLWVASSKYIAPMQNSAHTKEAKSNIKLGTIKAAPKTRKTMEERGYWIPLSQLPEVIKYRREVWKHTNKNAHLIPGYDASKRGRCSKKQDNWQVDHKLSITQGWVDSVPPEVLAHPINLAFIPWQENLKKWHNSSLTKEELINLISRSHPAS